MNALEQHETHVAAGAAAADARGPRSTPRQRLYIRTLLSQLELDTRRATLFHNRFWKAAGVDAPPLGTSLDDFLSGLSKKQASTIAAVIAKEVSDGE